MTKRLTLSVCVLAALLWPVASLAQQTGEIQGRIQHGDAGVRGVTILLLQDKTSTRQAVTADDGSFAFAAVPVGTYAIAMTLGNRSDYIDDVQVKAGAPTVVTRQVEWESGFSDAVTVFAASRRLERIVDAPAAVTLVTSDDVKLRAASGQLPRALEFAPGTEVTQSGLYDFNLNVRGFNTQLNRRIQTLVDGRDPSIPFLSSQEWASMTFLTDEVASMEFVRGPSSALYGPNAFNGVLDIRTLAPRDSQGGALRVSVGELNAARVSARWAGGLGKGWFVKLTGGSERSDTFSQSRNVNVEYVGVPKEAIPLSRDHMNVNAGSVRVDKYLTNGRVVTFEGGATSIKGTVLLTTTGRTQPDALRTWTRANVNSARWNALFYSNSRTTENQPALSSGNPLWLADRNYHVELQGNRELAGRVRVVGGGSYTRQTVDSSDAAGKPTLLSRSFDTNLGGVFGQADLKLSSRLKAVTAARLDWSTLHGQQFSPKGALVFTLHPGHTLRVSANRAFQVANYAELFVSVPAGAPINLSGLENAFRPLLGGTSLGFSAVPLLVRGNEDLKVETIRAIEGGYSGLIGGKAFVTIDIYRNVMRDFITDALAGLNPAYPKWVAPAGVPASTRATVEGAINSSVAGLTNLNGSPAIVLSLANTGRVTSYGTELGLKWQLTPRVTVDGTYSAFKFEVHDTITGTSVHPNAPSSQFAFGATYRDQRAAGSIAYRRVAKFPWASGRYVGDVPAYGVANADASWRLNDYLSLSATVSNLFNEEHYEVFGGDLLRRRAMMSLGVSWK
jgi:outer membrane receptor for ferrienterochelin and colicins